MQSLSGKIIDQLTQFSMAEKQVSQNECNSKIRGAY
jgi:hypothetical protein